MDITREFIKTLAAANGLTIPEERLEVVQRQYESFLRTLAEIQQLELPRETEPSILYTLEDMK
jgi:Asp-tRNA(Asn)/Glu-tRNA(Gln) amidotransferase C subunit